MNVCCCQALPPHAGSISSAAGHWGAGAASDPALDWFCQAVHGLSTTLSASPLLTGAQLLLSPLLPCSSGQLLPCGELRGVEGWGWPKVLALTLGFRSQQRSRGCLKRNGPGGEGEQ